ncbi:hypothetical protein D3C84_667900 [compost metagenome]
MPIQRADRAIEQQQAAAAEHILGAHMAELAIQLLPQLGLARVADRQIDMAALAGQGQPAAVGQGQQRADAEAGARADHHAGPLDLGRAGTDWQPLVIAQAGHAQGHGGKIVDQQQLAHLQLAAEGRAAEAPVVVGEAEQITADRAGAGQAHRIHRTKRQAQFAQVGTDRLFRPRIVGGGQHPHRLQLLVAPQGEARVGATNVTDQGQFHFSDSRLVVKAQAPCSAELKD